MVIIEDHKDKSDEELVALVLQNQEYFSYIVNRYQTKLLRYIIRISNLDKEDAEDVLQESFLKIYTNLNDFDRDLKFSSWIYRITHNRVISNYRKLQTRPQTVSLDISYNNIQKLASDFDLAKETDFNYLRKHILNILNRLELKDKEILTLKYLEEKSYKEISDILKKPMGTIATMISRAKKKFLDEFIKHNFKE